MAKRYQVNQYSDMLAPCWITDMINYRTTKFVYRIIDGRETLEGVMINGEIAKIGDFICDNGRQLTVERR